jgi:hypothetical protein
MQDQLTVSSSVLPSCAQHTRHHHQRTLAATSGSQLDSEVVWAIFSVRLIRT